jgi:hypothetical protein
MPPVGPRPQPPVGTCKVTIAGQLFGAIPTENVLWLQIAESGGALSADLQSVANSIHGDFETDVCPQLSSSWGTVQTTLNWIYSAGQSIEVVAVGSTVGSLGVAPENAATCAVVDWLIGRYYRGGHPRSYLAGIPSADITNGSQVSSGYASSLAGVCNTWRTAVNALTHGNITAVTLGTVSFANGNAWRTPPIFEAYTGQKVRLYLGSQRRRIGGR